VICDVEDRAALEVIEAIRSADPALAGRVLLVSGGAPPELSDRLAASGARVLAKPFGGRQLREALRELIGG
jgi:DNA-binding NarL/FixJ family response regulator